MIESKSIAQVERSLTAKIDAVDKKVDAVDKKVDAVERRLSDKIDAVDKKVDAVDKKIDETRAELITVIGATATSLEARIDRKLEGLEHRLTKAAERSAEAVVDRAVHRVIGAIYERSQQDASIRDDRIDALERKLDKHISNERIHVDD